MAVQGTVFVRRTNRDAHRRHHNGCRAGTRNTRRGEGRVGTRRRSPGAGWPSIEGCCESVLVTIAFSLFCREPAALALLALQDGYTPPTRAAGWVPTPAVREGGVSTFSVAQWHQASWSFANRFGFPGT